MLVERHDSNRHFALTSMVWPQANGLQQESLRESLVLPHGFGAAADPLAGQRCEHLAEGTAGSVEQDPQLVLETSKPVQRYSGGKQQRRFPNLPAATWEASERERMSETARVLFCAHPSLKGQSHSPDRRRLA